MVEISSYACTPMLYKRKLSKWSRLVLRRSILALVPSFGFFLSVRFTELAKKSFRALLCSILFSEVYRIRTHNESFFKIFQRSCEVILVLLYTQWTRMGFLICYLVGVKYYSQLWFLHNTGLLKHQRPKKN